MIILDTNIISELMKQAPSHAVIQWIDKENTTQLFITTMTIAEMTYGIEALPSGKRKHSLETSFDNVINEAFKHRVLFFDQLAANYYGKIMGASKISGKPLGILDGQIAAIARANDATVATRNIADFAHCGLSLINPFTL